MSIHLRVLVVSILFLSSTSLLPAQSGHWEGTIQAADKTLTIEFDLTKNAGGDFAGTFNLPAMRLQALPLANVAAHGDSVSFEIKGSGGGIFRGTLSADGKTLDGTFTGSDSSHSMEIPFSLKRTGDARIETAPKSAPIAKEFEGKWTGTLTVEGKEKQIGLTLTNQSDGTSTGSLTSSDGVQIAISSIVQNGPSLNLDVKKVGGSYSGKLSDGTIAGAWTQTSFVGPLNFRRVESPLDRWAKAVGGRDKIAAIRSIYREATIEVSGYTGSIKVWHTADGKYRKEEQVATLSAIETFDGVNGTVKQGDGPSRPMSGHELEVATSKAYANTNAILFAFSPEHHHGSVVVESDDTIVLEPQGGIDWRVTLDPATSLPKTMTHVEGGRTITVTFDSYDTVDGYKFEKEMHRSTGDPRFDAVIRFTKTVVNPPADNSLFTQ